MRDMMVKLIEVLTPTETPAEPNANTETRTNETPEPVAEEATEPIKQEDDSNER